ncbi:MAG: 3-oxoacyl-ACP reductase [Bacillaceae bacterium G1]|nr:3-oxoacyl-ACP reductase [Bacillota bacterium]OJF16446.1 MAG: 3-oxoacyl-ACP reductase [Bacillaceae bacterium G1]
MGMLEGKVAIITGAGRGVGQAAAIMMAKEGATVVVNDLDAGPAEETVKKIRELGGQALAFPGSVTDKDFPEKIMKKTYDEFGQIDILVNNAGYTWDTVIHKMTDEQWYAMIDVHTTAPFRMIRAAAPYMRDKAKEEIEQGQPPRRRKIVNVSSVSGLFGNAGQANYAAAKMGVVGLTKTVAKEWGRFHINCNAVAFGFIDTRLTQPKEKGESIDGKIALGIPSAMREVAIRMIPLQRIGQPEDAAGGILMLVSPYADYITGHVLVVDGGAHM